ncbi:MAG TPA: formyltransferase family protein, partial [Leptospiraceae bacterium]|nr:formyltransferase family protein [Leptospiraceae bacterium]
MKKKILVLASGMGSNFAAIREHIRKKKLKAEISALISDNPESNSLLLALSFKIDSVCIPYRKEDREGYNRDLLRKIRQYDPDLIVTAGYMKILPEFIVN